MRFWIKFQIVYKNIIEKMTKVGKTIEIELKLIFFKICSFLVSNIKTTLLFPVTIDVSFLENG